MRSVLRVAIFAALLSALVALDLRAQANVARKTPVRIIYSALTASNGPVWVAGDQGLFEKYGLDVQIVHGRGAAPIQVLAGGTVELGHFAGPSVISANLAGSDLIFVAAQSNLDFLPKEQVKDITPEK
jgi:ABC-type nitrate/sulfonate/bicarbonate transport system substrate-binding protein